MPMNSRLSSVLSEFSKGRWAAEPSTEPPLHPTELNLVTRVRSWLDKLVPFAFARYLMIFFIGVVATVAWQSYGGAARLMIANSSPHFAWLAPQTSPVAQTAPAAAARASPDQLKATALALAAVRQSVDKLAAEITRLQTAEQGTPDRSSAPPPPPAGVGVAARKPAPSTPPLSRAPPVR